MILALKTPLVETIIGTKIDFLNQFNIFFTFFFPANFVQFNSSTGLILLFLPFFYNTVSPATAQPLLLLNLSRDPFNSISYLHKSAWKSDLGRQTISQFVINYFLYHLSLASEHGRSCYYCYITALSKRLEEIQIVAATLHQ
jgi:hypothetical protein